MTIQDKVDATNSLFESKLNQTIPQNPKSFLRVLSVVESIAESSLERFAHTKAMQALATKADLEGLQTIGKGIGITYKAASAYQGVLSGQWSIESGHSPVGWKLVRTAGDVDYYYTVVSVDSNNRLVVASDQVGYDSNIGSSFLLLSESPNVTEPTDSRFYEFSAVALGSDDEELEDFRRRVIERQAGTPGGGTGYDYKLWAEETPGVRRAYCYSGLPSYRTAQYVGDYSVENRLDGRCMLTLTTGNNVFDKFIQGSWVKFTPSGGTNAGTYLVLNKTPGDILVSPEEFIYLYPPMPEEGDFTSFSVTPSNAPGQRTVFIEAADDNPVPTDSVLQAVRTRIMTDPTTGRENLSLGDTSETLCVVPVVVKSLSVTFTGVYNQSALLLSDLKTEFELLANSFSPYCDGVDSIYYKNNNVSVNVLIQAAIPVFLNRGAYFERANMYLDGVQLNNYNLDRGEIVRLSVNGLVLA